ncbi:hypothetical protein BJ170DRAFT_572729 [Xylariales sp. AK1849]|nr:hypothetical protein BJ170DRAFT_572729 [Xylariales sp. AK1849]
MPTALSQVDNAPAPICHIVTPVGMLSYGFNEEQTYATLSNLVATGVPTAIILDSGSTNSGPEKLALGTLTCPRSSYVRDLSKLVKLVATFRVPLIFSSAGGDGSDEHVREMVKIIEEISDREENGFLPIFSSVDKGLVVERLRSGAITGCRKFVPPLTEKDIEASVRIVGQMGPEPFTDGMTVNPDFDIIVGGRAYDPSPYVAYAAFLSGTLLEHADPGKIERLFGAFTHIGKVMECGGICAVPKSGGICAVPKSGGAIATVYRNGTFDITPMEPEAACTRLSVAAHTLYEKTRPDLLHGPGGYLDLTKATYKQLQDNRTVRVAGSTFHFSKNHGLPYTIKLEAAAVVGYRSIYMGSIRDPILIRQIEDLLERVKVYVSSQHRDANGQWQLGFYVYGRDGHGHKTPATRDASEVFFIGEALADSQSLATGIASSARIATTHGSYSGQKATSGNFAFGIGGKLEIEMGPCSQFSVYHMMNLEDGEDRLQLGDHDGPGGSRLQLRQSVSIIGRGCEHSLSSSIPAPVQIVDKLEKDVRNTSASGGTNLSVNEETLQPTTLGDLSQLLRSKNSGPWEITFDVMFGSQETYSTIKESGMLSPETVASALDLPVEQVIWSGFFDPALAFKVTIPRIRAEKITAAGSFMEDDVHGSQQHRALANMKLPDKLIASLVE